MNNKRNIVIFLMGPTASNKTKLAITLSKYLPIDLISVDSGLIYKELNIGTAKPSKTELIVFPHKLINIISMTQYYCVQSFKKDALFEIKNSISNNRIPLLVGGTMFYYNSLFNGLSNLPSRNDNIRKIILENFTTKSSNNLYKQLISIDPISALKIHPNDSQRVLRALEVYYISGKKLSDLIKYNNYKFPYKVLKFISMFENKNSLHKNIELRLMNMINSGFQDEVEKISLNNGFNKNIPGMKCIGYKYMYNYILGKITYQDMFLKTLISTKQLAKNQLTWLKKIKNYFLINSKNINFSVSFMLNKINKFLRI
ncbi:tRNA (adenosine(37)-N6)-dimethylallyltransferase MiaA [Buchnera aphidicola (Periphyllus koelreuteriae)]|uniref:tRNA (adenosine(37)-N6)-dimethylallyltransferase MiaA n=1 Tax=Buchnera aphidicola TaxID=9 RepID=UPI0031B852C8